MFSWWKKGSTDGEVTKWTIKDVLLKIETAMAEDGSVHTPSFIVALRTTIEMTGDFGSSWKFALEDVLSSVTKLHEIYIRNTPEDEARHPYSALQEMIIIETEKMGTMKGEGTKCVLELLHVLNYAQSLFEELLTGESEFIFNQFLNEEPVIPNRDDEGEHSFVESEEVESKGKKSFRKCAYDAYQSSLAPKHSKAIQYMVWTASFTLPSRKTAYKQVFKAPKEEVNEAFSKLIPMLRHVRKELYTTIVSPENKTK